MYATVYIAELENQYAIKILCAEHKFALRVNACFINLVMKLHGLVHYVNDLLFQCSAVQF